MTFTLQHSFLAIDEGKQTLSLIDTTRPDFGWTIALTDYPLARDLQRLDENRVLVGFDRGFFELEIATGKVLSVRDGWKDVTGATRLPDGSTLVTGFNLDGQGGVNVLTLDADGNVVNTARREGDYVRLMRLTSSGTYLLCTNDHILETNADLTAVRELRAEGFLHAWKAERFADGTTLVAAGYGAFIAVFGADGQLMKTFGGAADVPAEVSPFFYASFQVLANDHIVVANWQGHGEDNGEKGRQLLEFNAEGALLGTWSDSTKLSSLQGILIL
jgi:hypothetical protein